MSDRKPLDKSGSLDSGPPSPKNGRPLNLLAKANTSSEDRSNTRADPLEQLEKIWDGPPPGVRARTSSMVWKGEEPPPVAMVWKRDRSVADTTDTTEILSPVSGPESHIFAFTSAEESTSTTPIERRGQPMHLQALSTMAGKILEKGTAYNKTDKPSQQDTERHGNHDKEAILEIDKTDIVNEVAEKYNALISSRYIDNETRFIFPKDFEIYTSSLQKYDELEMEIIGINNTDIGEVSDQELYKRQEPIFQQMNVALNEAEVAHQRIQDETSSREKIAQEITKDIKDDKLPQDVKDYIKKSWMLQKLILDLNSEYKEHYVLKNGCKNANERKELAIKISGLIHNFLENPVSKKVLYLQEETLTFISSHTERISDENERNSIMRIQPRGQRAIMEFRERLKVRLSEIQAAITNFDTQSLPFTEMLFPSLIAFNEAISAYNNTSGPDIGTNAQVFLEAFPVMLKKLNKRGFLTKSSPEEQ